nr:hypothetical protein [Tanacetum cinerariifolium]
DGPRGGHPNEEIRRDAWSALLGYVMLMTWCMDLFVCLGTLCNTTSLSNEVVARLCRDVGWDKIPIWRLPGRIYPWRCLTWDGVS